MTTLHRQQGFTLVEVITVMLVLVAIASITVESSKDFVFQNRYEITKDRYEKIKKAIIGDSNQVINGQPNIEGFVKDMGRLPDNIRELFQTGYCRHTVTNTPITTKRRYYMCGGLGSQEEWMWINTPCSKDNPANQTKISCENDGGIWLGQEIDTGTTTNSGLYFGWKGYYLGTGKNAADNSAITDGWGNTETNEVDHPNYGWHTQYKKSDGTNINPVAGTTPIIDAVTIDIQSKGKDGFINTADTGYNEDYPKAAALPSIKQSDWTVNVNGIQANVMALGFKGSCSKQPVSMPSSTMCQGGTFSELSQPTDKLTCEAANGTWNSTASSCSGVNIPICSWTQQQMCSLASGIWLTSLNSTTCNSLGGIWNNTTSICSGVTPPPLCSISKSLCDLNGGSWQPSSSTICMTISYRSIDSTTGQTKIQQIRSNPTPAYQAITEDGREHLISFPFFKDIDSDGIQDANEEDRRIPFGSISVGIYTDCNNNQPITRYKPTVSSDIQITLYPNTTLPTINW